jgi:hypothetical protein
MILRKASDNAKQKTVCEAKLIVSATRCLGYECGDLPADWVGEVTVNIAIESEDRSLAPPISGPLP